jgi:hypothetical protein
MITEVQPHHIGSHTTLAVVRKSNFSKEATMSVLKAAIVGLALISANTPVRADVIADWNSTPMDVMKAVNVAGNPWTRSMAPVNVSMSDAVNSVQNRYSRYMPELPSDPNAALPSIRDGQAVGHGERESVPPASAPGPQRCALRAITMKQRKWEA